MSSTVTPATSKAITTLTGPNDFGSFLPLLVVLVFLVLLLGREMAAGTGERSLRLSRAFDIGLFPIGYAAALLAAGQILRLFAAG